MIVYLKNQSNYKMKDFEGMSYAEIRPIFEKVWDYNHNFVPMDLEVEKEKKKPAEFQEIEIEQIEKYTTGKRKKSLPRKRTRSTTNRQKVELEDEKEDLKGYLDIVPREDVDVDVDSPFTKFPIMDWKTYTLSENFMYYKIIRGDGSSKNYKILSEMLYDFDRQDVVELYRLVKERYSSSKPEGYDLMLWGDLHTLFEPDEESEIWMNQNEYNPISWSLCDFRGVHILLMQNGIAIHMLTEKKYPLSQEMISKMLSKKLEVNHKFRGRLLGINLHQELILPRIDQGLGSTSGIRACALRNFDLEVMELENTQNNALAKLPMLKLGEYEMWEIRIKQYFQIQDYALWEVIENGNSWVPIPVTTPPETGTSTTLKMTLPATIEEKTCKKNDVKARTRFGAMKQHRKDTEGSVETNSMCGYPLEDLNLMASNKFPEDLEQLHDDDLEEMDLKWNMALLSMRARKLYQRTGRKIIIDGSNTAGYDKSKERVSGHTRLSMAFSDTDDNEDEVESHEKKTDIPTTAKTEKPVRKQVRYAEMYKSQRPRGNQRNWNGQKSNQLGYFDGGYVTFGGGAYGGRITGKGTIKTDNLDFDDVYFVKELKFNLFSVSQMCDKKNYVLFTDSESTLSFS
ncbi:hypothetical protein Tco_0842711 [Tanacetum coccineum]|uniref:Uncharacterized protein n=1 Tax=Tanacetum coccineum TaxID=301880 RepID=A0ABQ5B4D7_9ASTR